MIKQKYLIEYRSDTDCKFVHTTAMTPEMLKQHITDYMLSNPTHIVCVYNQIAKYIVTQQVVSTPFD